MSVPALRFKEFNYIWDTLPLGNIFDIVVGFVGTVSSHYCNEKNGVPFIRTLNVKDGWFSHDDIQYVTPEFHANNKKSQLFNEDILIARVGANMGMVCKVSGLKTEANSANIVIIKQTKLYNSDFYTQYLCSPLGQKQIQEKGAGGAQEVLNISVTKTILVPTPSFDEQTKIANFLTAVDEKITQLTKKTALLAQYKKGVMQQIFSQELRFKDDDGSDFPGWSNEALSHVAQIIMGSSPPSGAYNEDENGLPLIQGNADIKARKSAPRIYTSQITKECLPSDILLSVRAPVGTVAISEHHACIGRGISAIRAKQNTKQDFLYQWLLEYEPRWKSLSQGSTFESVNSDQIKSIEIPFPSKKEQTKIANLLTAIDDKITQIQAQLDAVRHYKQGLLQQMFV